MRDNYQVVGQNVAAPFTPKVHRGDGMVLLARNWKSRLIVWPFSCVMGSLLLSCANAQSDDSAKVKSKAEDKRVELNAALHPVTRRTLRAEFTPQGKGPIKVAFFDADSTLRVSRSGSVSASNPMDVAILPGVSTKLGQISRDGYLIAIVSNQGGIPKFVSLDDANRAFQYTIKLLNDAGAPADYYDFAEVRALRKPNVGMGTLAAQIIKMTTGRDVDWRNSYMVGDSAYKKDETDPQGRPGVDFSNSDRGFAENLAETHEGFKFFEPDEYFGWDKFEIRRFNKLHEVQDFFKKRGSDAFSI